MLRKLLSTYVTRTASGSGSYDDAQQIGAFYASLSKGLMDLGDSIGIDSPSFSLESLRLAVDFVRSMHSDVLALIEEIWVPAHVSGGMDVLTNYMDMSKRFLDLCNCITNAMGQLESYQMSLEVALASLSSAMETLSVGGDDSKALSSIAVCKGELRKMESKKHAPNLWAIFVSSFKEDRVGMSKKAVASMKRSVTSLPSSRSLDRKALDISLVMADVQSVATFISSMILWVLTESSEQFEYPVDLDTLAQKGIRGDWSAPLRRLTEKVKHAGVHPQSKDNTKFFLIVHRLREFEGMRRSVNRLCEMIEEGLKHCENKDVWLVDTSRMLTQTSEKLAEMLKSLEKLAEESQQTFSEISSSRRKILDVPDIRTIPQRF